MGLFKKDTAVLNEKDKKIRNIIGAAGIAVIAGVLALNVFAGFGRHSRDIIYEQDGKNIIYDFKSGENKDLQYMSYGGRFLDFSKEGGGEYRAHFDSDVCYYAEENNEAFDIYFDNGKSKSLVLENISAMRFAQNGEDAVLFEKNSGADYTAYFVSEGKTEKIAEGCTDAAAVGRKKSRYLLYEQKGSVMFYNFKDEPYALSISNMDAHWAALSYDERRLMIIAGDERSLYSFTINNVESNTTEALKVGENVKAASFTGFKNDFAFLEDNGDFYYSSGGYTSKEQSGVEKFDAGYDVMSVYYITENGDFYSMYVGNEKLLDKGVIDFYYAGSNNTAVIKDFDESAGQGTIYHINKSGVSETERKAEKFCRY